MSTARLVARNSVLLGTAHIASKFIYMILLIQISRFLGDSGFGRFSFAYAFVLLFMYLGDVGLTALTTRDVSRDNKLAGRYVGALIIIKSMTSVVVMGLIMLISMFLGKSGDVVLTIWVMGGAIVLLQFQNNFLSIFRAFGTLSFDSLQIMIEKLLLVSVGLFVLFIGGDVLSIAWVYLATEVVVTIFLAVSLFRKVKPVFAFDTGFWRKLISQSWPFAIMSNIGVIYFQIGVVALGLFWPERVVGWYGASLQLTNALLFIPQVFNLATFPLLSKYFIRSKNSLEVMNRLSIKLMSMISLPIAFGTSIIAWSIIRLLYGLDFRPGVAVLQIVVWAIALRFLNSQFNNLLNATQNQKFTMRVSVVSSIILIVSSILLIPSFSLIGAAVSLVLSEFTAFCMLIVIVRKNLFVFSLTRAVFRSLLSAVFMAAVIFPLRDASILVTIPLAVISYVFAVIVLRVMNPEEKKLIREVIGQKLSAFLG